MYLLDTNLYIAALRDSAFAAELDAFQLAVLPRLWVSAVVAYEITTGARDRRHEQALERWLVRPFRSRRRVLVPGEATWAAAARVNRVLRGRKGLERSLEKASFQNDILIALTCREVGATLITANRADFGIIQGVTGVPYLTAFPVV